MDDRTRSAYSLRAVQFAELWDSVPSPLRTFWPMAFRPGDRVLDIGAGSGRDLASLVAEGYDAVGVEPIEPLRGIATGRRSELVGRVFDGTLPDALGSVQQQPAFNGVVCSAVLQHLPRSTLFDSVYAIRELVVPGGTVLISVPSARADVDRDEFGRWSNGVTGDELALLFERGGFTRIRRFVEPDALGRAGSWDVLLLRRAESEAARPLDLVAGVLSHRERKVATYKLALLRALCDIALTSGNLASWRDDGLVRVPYRAVAERWIHYYWPLFTAPRFLPQMNGEWNSRQSKLAFGSQLDRLIVHYRSRGDLTAYAVDERDGQFDPVAAGLRKHLLRKLGDVIRSGPVTFAGGSLESGRLFASERDNILVAADLWRELTLTGHWIQEALLIRWAELSSGLAKGDVSPGDVLTALLVRPDPARETAAARAVFNTMPDLRCVWTDVALRRAYDVDHVIPFSMWHNNDLWNLLPADPKVNREKSDALPTIAVLHDRRPRILDCWEACRDALPHRFTQETTTRLGRVGDLAELFHSLVEAVETTALQRGAQRWPR